MVPAGVGRRRAGRARRAPRARETWSSTGATRTTTTTCGERASSRRRGSATSTAAPAAASGAQSAATVSWSVGPTTAVALARADPARPRARRRVGRAVAGPDRRRRRRRSRATCTAALRERATSSRWSTTASSTGSWRPMRRGSACWPQADVGEQAVASSTPRRRRCARPSTIATTSTSPRSPSSGGGARVVSSWLLDLTAQALARRARTWRATAGRCLDSGEGRWTVQAAIDEGVPTPVLSAALTSRFASQGYADVRRQGAVSAMRFGFGGHLEKGPANDG